MISANYTTIQEVRRNYKKIVKEVNETQTPTVVISNNQPQFAIVSVDMLKTMGGNAKSAQGLLALARWAEKEHIRGPKDLSDNHNRYVWDNQ